MSFALHPRAVACGKVILVGEHSVVHGQPALAAGLPDALVLEAAPLADPRAPTTLSIPAWDLELVLAPGVDHPVARAALEVLSHCDGPLAGAAIRGHAGIPAQAGLGSSAALTVALARLVLGADADPEEVVAASLVGERVFHGNPSGVDSEVAARGGVLRFVRGQTPRSISWAGPLRIVLVPSGVARHTAVQVGKVQARVDRFPTLANPMLAALGAATDAAQVALESGDLDALGEIMNVSHALLSGLDVSSRTLDELCATAREAGARGAKLTGAGGGGCILALPPDDPSPVLDAFRGRGLAPLVVDIHAP
jgi:mevalonate kinase